MHEMTTRFWNQSRFNRVAQIRRENQTLNIVSRIQAWTPNNCHLSNEVSIPLYLIYCSKMVMMALYSSLNGSLNRIGVSLRDLWKKDQRWGTSMTCKRTWIAKVLSPEAMTEFSVTSPGRNAPAQDSFSLMP